MVTFVRFIFAFNEWKCDGCEATCQADINTRYRLALPVLNFGARWRCVVNATFRPLCSREEDPLPLVREDGRDPENLAPTGFRTPDSSARSDSQ